MHRQSKLLALLLYHGLTTGCGLQTLGEEYCNLLKVGGAGGGLPSSPRLVALVLLQSLAPYLSEAAATHLDTAAIAREAEGGDASERTGESEQRDGDGSAGTAGGTSRVESSCVLREHSPSSTQRHLQSLLFRKLSEFWPTHIRWGMAFTFHRAILTAFVPLGVQAAALLRRKAPSGGVLLLRDLLPAVSQAGRHPLHFNLEADARVGGD